MNHATNPFMCSFGKGKSTTALFQPMIAKGSHLIFMSKPAEVAKVIITAADANFK
jgi:hypothetical protein